MGLIFKVLGELSQVGEVIEQISSINNISSCYDDIAAATENLSLKNTLLALSTSKVSKEDAELILIAKGVKDEEIKQAMATYSVASSQTTATKSTFSLSSAFKGLASSIGISTAALGGITAAIAAIGLVAIGISHYNKAQKEAVDTAKKATDIYSDASTSVDDYTERYEKLRKQLILAKGNEEETYNVKKQLLELQNELNDKFGEAYGRINLVTDAYKNQTEAIKNLNKESANTFLNENEKGIKIAQDKMSEKNDYTLSMSNVSLEAFGGEELQEIVDSYKDNGMYLLESGEGIVEIRLEADAEIAYETINSFETDLRDKAKELGDEHLFDSILSVSSEALNDSKDIIDEYGEIHKKSLAAEIVTDENKSKVYNEALNAVEEYNKAVLQSADPYNDENVAKAKANLDSLKDKISEGGEEWSKYSPIMNDIFDQADTRLLDFNEKLKTDKNLIADAQAINELGYDNLDLASLNKGESEAFDRLSEAASGYGLEVSDLIDLLVQLGYVQGEVLKETSEKISLYSKSQMINAVNGMSDGFDVLADIYDDIIDGADFDFTKLDTKKFEEAFKGLQDEYTEFIETVSDSPRDIKACQDAFNKLAGSYIKNNNILENLTDENANVTAAMLKNMGVTNAEAIVVEQLALNKEKAKESTQELAEAELSEVASHINVANGISIEEKALAQLALEKMLVNGIEINTYSDAQNIYALAQAAGVGIEKLKQLQTLMDLITKRDTIKGKANKSNDDFRALSELNRAINEFQNTALNDIEYEVEYKYESPTAAEAGEKAADAYVKAFEKELESLKILRDRGEIDEKEYLDRLKVLYEKYFKDRKEYLDEFKKYETEYLEGMESLYNSALSGITKLLDKRIDAINKEKDTVLEALEEEKEARLEALETQIDAKQEVIDAIQKEIDKMQEANEERKRQIDLQKAQYDLERLQNQKTQLIYKDGQMVYQTDSSGIRDAREEVADAKLEIEIANKEKQISLLEEEIELLEKQRENVEDYYDKMIEQQEKYFDSLIKNLETQKSKWEELADIKEVAEAYSAIELVFGDLGYTVEDVLNGSAGAFEDFKSKYLSILGELNSTDSFGEGLDYAVKELDKSLSTLGSDTTGLDNLTSKMGEVEDSVGSVTNAISGSGSSGGSTETSSGAKGQEAGSTGGTSSSLKGAIAEQTEEAITKLQEQADAFSGDEESLEQAVQNVIEKIVGGSSDEEQGTGSGSKEKSETDATNLKGAIQAQYDTAATVLPLEEELFNKLCTSIKNCVTELTTMVELLESMPSGSNWKMMGTVPIYPNAKGTVGNAFAKGYNGLPHNEKNALRSEYGQPELTVYPDGTTELTTKPIMSDLPKDTVIFNEEQTRRIMNGKGTILGKAFANGTVLNPVTTIQGIDIESLQDKFLGKLDNIIVPVDSLDKNVESMVRMGNTIHTNNASQDINISIGDIQLHGVQDVNGLANAISTKLPNMLLQTITKR